MTPNASRTKPALDEHNKAALQAMRKARDFPANTCGSSRHAELIAEQLIRGRPCHMLADEPQHCGESIAHTVAALWAARAQIEQLRKEAERYQFLRDDFSPMGVNIDGNHAWAYRRNATLKGPNLDAAIDAAILAQPPRGDS
jgi:hypothetical protein